MPKKPKRPCSYPGCPRLTDGRFCEKHRKSENQRYEKYDRDPAAKRKYGRAWKRIRDRYMNAHPLCERCQQEGRLIKAEQEAQQDEADESEDVQYDEDGNVIENTDEDTAEDDTEHVDEDADNGENDDASGDTENTEDNADADYDNSTDASEESAEDTSSDSDSSSYSSGSGSSVVNYATQFVGNPYVWGGTSLTNGADCSGFVQSVYANFGVSLPRTSYEQQNAGTEVSYADAQPGDLICYGGHVAIYMGNGQIVHASNSQDGIKISNDATYRTIVSVRRLV